MKRLAESINSRLDPSKQISINIYGLTGGNYKQTAGDPSGRIGSCSICYIDNFYIESIKECIPLKDINFDLVFSRSTFQHLTDSLGTLTDVFKKLKAGGLFIGDVPGSIAEMIIGHTTPDIAHTLMSILGTPLASSCFHLALLRTSDKELLLPVAYDPKKPVIYDGSGKGWASYVTPADPILEPEPQIKFKNTTFTQNSPNTMDFLLSSTVLDDSILYNRWVFYLGLKKKMESHPDTPISQLILTEEEFAASAREYKALPDKEGSTFLMQDMALLKRAKELDKQMFDRETTDNCILLKSKAK